MSEQPSIAELFAEKLGVDLPASTTTPPVPTKMDTWRADNPHDIKWWPTANGGVVIQQRSVRTFYGTCKRCGASVQRSRDVSRRGRKGGPVLTGRWPDYCAACERLRDEENAGVKARRYKRQWRANEKALRDAQREAQGLPPIRQGVPTGYERKPTDYVAPQPAEQVTADLSEYASDPPAGWPTTKPWWPVGNPNRDASIDELEREILLARERQ